jgi:hypothetical protein
MRDAIQQSQYHLAFDFGRGLLDTKMKHHDDIDLLQGTELRVRRALQRHSARNRLDMSSQQVYAIDTCFGTERPICKTRRSTASPHIPAKSYATHAKWSDINTRSFPSAVPSLLPKVILTTFQSTTTLHNNGFDNSLCCKEETRSMRRQWLLGYANHKNPKLVRTKSVTPTAS